ncbi:hypothetical protein Pst134EA_009652 [Puccinia striiformis f. sp. tritici]|uniref:hypothetical protein n=1 Tax=Puccinia striiformis f. sp. tritici TaxID=168172 RepID=UPI002007D059|nr:hypothetical protein Pst134EA_009652 [Puccinia striiformis f. sp. tritici]KAH9458446.1 hypothetical protein Pst134EB_010749 [Puccinia striiformis f. sp. tritici]KAH9469123.1 hypothetical protein Pst134EA_009652 [Puccinia striiformis f. sp. tritici]
MVEVDLDISQFPTIQRLAIHAESSVIGHEIVLLPRVNYIPSGVPLIYSYSISIQQGKGLQMTGCSSVHIHSLFHLSSDALLYLPFKLSRLRDRSVTPPRHRENPYMSRDPRHDLEVSPHEHRHHRRRSPLGEIDYTRTERDRLPLSARESYFLPAHAEDKRFRPDHSFRGDRERDDQRALDLKILPRGEEYRAPYLIPSSRSRSPPPGSRDYYTRHPAPYPVRSLPRNDYQGRVHELKSYAPEPAYYRDHVRAAEPPRMGRYEDRSPDRQQYAYPLERIVEPTRIDRRYEVPDARVITRGHSPRRARSPRRSPSPSRRPPTHRRPLGRSPPPYESAGYGRPASYPIRR